MAASTHRLGANHRDTIIKAAGVRLSDVAAGSTTDYAELICGDGVPSGGYGRNSGASLVYLRKDASGVDVVVYVSADGGTTWNAVESSGLGSDAGLTSLVAADAAAGLLYLSAANTYALLTLAADKGIRATAAGALATYDLTAAGLALLDDASAAAQRTTLGVGTTDSPQFVAVKAGSDMWANSTNSLGSVLTYSLFDDFVVLDPVWTVTEDDAACTQTTGDNKFGAVTLTNTATTDDNAQQIQHSKETFRLVSGKKIWFECSVLSASGDMVNSDWFIGLSATEDLTGVPDNHPANGFGFYKDDGAATYKIGSSDNGVDVNSAGTIGTIVNATPVRLGLLFDGGASGVGTLTPYVDGVAGTPISVTYGTMTEVAPIFMVRNGDAATTQTLIIDYCKVVQER